jgi:light-regulated signal transduction histidine kinase (bacteriophytochrome)
MLSRPGSAPADTPADRHATALAAPRSPQPWLRLLAGIVAGAALAGLAFAGHRLAEHWRPDLLVTLALVCACAALLAWAWFAMGPRERSPAAHPGPHDHFDGLPAPAVLLQRQGERWQVVEGNAAARAGNLLPAAGTTAADWLSQVDPVLCARGNAEAAASETESFAYTVSHDLRAPIRVIEGFTRIVREDYGQVLDRIGNDHLDRVLGAAARMNSMIDAMLALAQLSSQPLARQRVDLSRLAQYVLDDLQKHAPQRRVETRVMPGLEIEGDPTLLRLVLENLLGNAHKYSSRREVAHIEFGAESRSAAATGTAQRVFYVSDDGAGFDMRFADRLFGAFQRLHSASEFQGTGVGLASVRRIVRRHGGEIWAEAEVDKGATFYFTLG